MTSRTHPRCITRLAGFLLTLTVTTSGLAQESMSSDKWKFTATPYIWAANLGGTAGIREFVGDVDVKFGDLVKNLKFASQLGFAARHGRWGVLTDFGYMKLGEDFDRPNAFFASGDVTAKSLYLFAVPMYRAVEGNWGWLEVGVGTVYYRLDIDLDLTTIAGGEIDRGLGRTDDWWDALVAVRGRNYFSERFFVHEDFGIGAGESDLVFNVTLMPGYESQRALVGLCCLSSHERRL